MIGQDLLSKLQSAVNMEEAIEGRTWDECEKYIISTLFKRAQEQETKLPNGKAYYSCGADEELISLAIHYFTEPSLEEWEDVTKAIEVKKPTAAPVKDVKPEPTHIKPAKRVKKNTDNSLQLSLW